MVLDFPASGRSVVDIRRYSKTINRKHTVIITNDAPHSTKA